MSTDTTTAADDTTDEQTDDNFDFGRLTVRGFGPVVQTEDRSDIVVARQVQAQVDRPVRDADDLWTLTKQKRGKKGSRRDLEAAVVHLLDGYDDLRPPRNDPHWADDWAVSVEGSVAAWVALAGQVGGSTAEYLETLTRRAAPDENLYLAALEYVDDMAVDREELLERYRAAAGMDGDSDD